MSLLEVAVVLFILVLILGSILVPLNTASNNRAIAQTQKDIADIEEAIIGHAVARGFLPCPDLTAGAGSNDGVEDVTGNACTATAGNVPWATLGTGAFDSWGNRYRYVVLPAFASRAVGSLTLSTPATLRICPFANCLDADLLVHPTVANARAAAVIISHGKNGYGARNANTGTANIAPTSADELANVGTSAYVSRIHSDSGATSGEFDDIVAWIARPDLFNAMVRAQRLP